MRLLLESEDSLLLETTPGALTVEGAADGHGFSPFHMLAGGLATCTFSVLHGWAEHAGLDTDGLALRVHWHMAEDPRRVGSMTVEVIWPGLPETRRGAIPRVAELCPIHATLQHAPEIVTRVPE